MSYPEQDAQEHRDAARHDLTRYRHIAGQWHDADDVPDRGDLEDE